METQEKCLKPKKADKDKEKNKDKDKDKDKALKTLTVFCKFSECGFCFQVCFFIIFNRKNNCLNIEKPIYVCYNVTDNELLCPREDLL